MRHSDATLALLGDMNVNLDKHSTHLTFFKSVLSDHQLIDTYRHEYEVVEAFSGHTRFSWAGLNHSNSIIDGVFLTCKHLEEVTMELECTITKSNHVVLELQLKKIIIKYLLVKSDTDLLLIFSSIRTTANTSLNGGLKKHFLRVKTAFLYP